MKYLLFLAPTALALTAQQPAPIATPTALTEVHKRDLSCLAAFAIIASEQERNIPSALEYPLLSERGRTYAGIVGQRVTQETGQTREQIHQAILDAIAAQQDKVKDTGDPDTVVQAVMTKCLSLLDVEVPMKEQPTLNQCAVMLQLAYEEVYAREKLSKTAQDLKTLAFVLDSRAREEMRNQGMSGNESDVELLQIREKIVGEAKIKEPKGQSSDLDFDHCFELAAPEPKDQKFEH
ncbi:hypothetical protein MNBD_ALPHA04-716 [hydrothermal vent metagenome]|uniref:Uncharacterized protein n=1 Tax=hydrothermal vent metagenome TaxID=652676 RepID=A0A3B0S5U6_9ZZZZ